MLDRWLPHPYWIHYHSSLTFSQLALCHQFRQRQTQIELFLSAGGLNCALYNKDWLARTAREHRMSANGPSEPYGIASCLRVLLVFFSVEVGCEAAPGRFRGRRAASSSLIQLTWPVLRW